MKHFILVLILFFSFRSSAENVSDGLKLTRIEQGTIYQRLGLKNGDIIIKVNNEHPKSSEAFQTWLSNAKAGDKIDVLIKRKGKEKTLHYTIK